MAVARAQRTKADARYAMEFPTPEAHADKVKSIKKDEIRSWVRRRLGIAKKEKAASVRTDRVHGAGGEIMSMSVESAFLSELEKIAATSAAKQQLALKTRQALLKGQQIRDTGKLIQKGKIEIPVTQRGVKWDDVKKSPKGGILKRLARFKNELKNGPKKKPVEAPSMRA